MARSSSVATDEGLALNSYLGNVPDGLSNPIGIALLTAIVGGLLIKEKRNVVWDEEDLSRSEA